MDGLPSTSYVDDQGGLTGWEASRGLFGERQSSSPNLGGTLSGLLIQEVRLMPELAGIGSKQAFFWRTFFGHDLG
jgi:hypothetical protein